MAFTQNQNFGWRTGVNLAGFCHQVIYSCVRAMPKNLLSYSPSIGRWQAALQIMGVLIINFAAIKLR